MPAIIGDRPAPERAAKPGQDGRRDGPRRARRPRACPRGHVEHRFDELRHGRATRPRVCLGTSHDVSIDAQGEFLHTYEDKTSIRMAWPIDGGDDEEIRREWRDSASTPCRLRPTGVDEKTPGKVPASERADRAPECFGESLTRHTSSRGRLAHRRLLGRARAGEGAFHLRTASSCSRARA